MEFLSKRQLGILYIQNSRLSKYYINLSRINKNAILALFAV